MTAATIRRATLCFACSFGVLVGCSSTDKGGKQGEDCPCADGYTCVGAPDDAGTTDPDGGPPRTGRCAQSCKIDGDCKGYCLLQEPICGAEGACSCK